MSKAFVRMCVGLSALIMVACSAGQGNLGEIDGFHAVADFEAATVAVEQVTQPDGISTGFNPTSGELEYDSAIIEVWYYPEFSMPRELEGYSLPEADSASTRPNSILRQNSEYEELTEAIAARYGVEIRRQLYWQQVNFATFDIPEGVDGDHILAELANGYPEAIESVSFAGLAEAAWEPTDPDYHSNTYYGGVLWGLKNVNVAPAWDYTRGERSIRVGVVDSGIRITHEELFGIVMTPAELANEIPEGWNLDVANDDNTVDDLSGHGTMCAAAVAAANNGNTIIGMAPGVTVLPIKIHDVGTFPWTDGYAGITLAHLLGSDIISCSWGHSGGFNNQEKQIIEQVTNGGSLVIAAAGNDNTTESHYPSDFTDVICVGASDPDDVRCDFSNYGDAVDISAPGQWMKRALHTGDSDYDETGGGGTSYACPMVSGGAALLMSADPSLTNDEVRTLLETTGDPVTGGFQSHVKRMNIGNAMAQTTAVRMTLPAAPTQLIHSGTIVLEPEISGDVDFVDCKLNGGFAGSLTSPPWQFSIDTTAVEFGYANIEFLAYQGTNSVSGTMRLLVDNTAGVYPMVEGFEAAARDLLPVEHKDYDPALLQQLRTYGEMGSYWTPQDLHDNGAGVWGDTSQSYEGYTCKRFGGVEGGYDAFEADTLISRLIDLGDVADPTMVFHQHYNIQRGNNIYDRALVMVTRDYGETFSLAKTSGGDDAIFSGFVESWEKVEIDLSEFAGEAVHIAMVFESGRQNSGENADYEPGWWVDDFTVASGYLEHIPSIGGVSISPFSTFGEVLQIDEIDVDVTEPDNVARVEFILEYVLQGSSTPERIKIDASNQPFQAVVAVPLDIPNQVANLVVNYFSDGETSGPGKTIPVYIFNQLGDTNADGKVDHLDSMGYSGKIGLTSADSGYIPFFDSDLDGIITELDAAVVGYHWGE